MLFDYLIAASLGFLCMLGVARWADEILLLHSLTTQQAVAELVLREVQTTAGLLQTGDGAVGQICNTDGVLAVNLATCESVTPWLEYLHEYRLEQTESGQFTLVWRDTRGQWSSLNSAQINPSPVTSDPSHIEMDTGATVAGVERL